MSDPEPQSSEPGESARAIDLLAERIPEGVDLDRLSGWVDRLTLGIVPDADSFVVRLTDDATIRKINSRYRGKDTVTDVLSFPGDQTPEGRHLGDVVIAIPVAEHQAHAADHSLETELKNLVLHGVLHCMGYDHETDLGEMEARERDLRREWIESNA